MDALEECHRKEFLSQALGMCNFEKDELSKCLHTTRVEDAKTRIRARLEKQRAAEEQRKKIEEDTYGKNGYLRKVIEIEAKKREKGQ